MYIRRNYGFWMTLNWSKWPFICGARYAAVIAGLNVLLDIDLILPWQPFSVLGIAVAFYLGFKNNSSYDRTWEARKIWGGIVNSSRTFASAVASFSSLVDNDEQRETQRTQIYCHIAWLTALRY
jgi:ion channel-forming bestrophin family protein